MTNCPSCGSETIPDANFCGRCGVKLKLVAAPPVAACRCGAGPESIDAAGFCNECGVRQIDADPRDHEEQVVDVDFAGVTDRGRRHTPPTRTRSRSREGPSPSGRVRLAVVCDGVSTSSAAAQASAAAVAAFRDAALAARRARRRTCRERAGQAADAAQRAVLAVPYPSDAARSGGDALGGARSRPARRPRLGGGQPRLSLRRCAVATDARRFLVQRHRRQAARLRLNRRSAQICPCDRQFTRRTD